MGSGAGLHASGTRPSRWQRPCCWFWKGLKLRSYRVRADEARWKGSAIEYGLLYYVACRELNERSDGQIDLRLRASQSHCPLPLAMALAPGQYFNSLMRADEAALQPGPRSTCAPPGVADLVRLIIPHEIKVWRGFSLQAGNRAARPCLVGWAVPSLHRRLRRCILARLCIGQAHRPIPTAACDPGS